MYRIYIIDGGTVYWFRRWLNDGDLDHLVFTTEWGEANRFYSRQKAEDYMSQMKYMGYDAHVYEDRRNDSEESNRHQDDGRPGNCWRNR